MDHSPLPKDLRILEDRLVATSRWAPPDGLRHRVMKQCEHAMSRSPRSTWWQFAGGLAATVALGINLSMSTVLATDLGLSRTVSQAPFAELVREVERTLPEITHRDAVAFAMTLQSGSHLSPHLAAVGGRPSRVDDVMQDL